MVAATNSITTKTEGWREKCRKWAEAGKPFALRDLETRHFIFCQEICDEYDYSYKYHCRGPESVAKFKCN